MVFHSSAWQPEHLHGAEVAFEIHNHSLIALDRELRLVVIMLIKAGNMRWA